MTRNPSLRAEAFRKALLIMLLLSPVWILVTWYQARNAHRGQQEQIRQILQLHASSLDHIFLRLTNELDQMHEFLRQHDTASPDSFADSFADIASGMRADSDWVQAYQIIENGVITHCYPKQGNEAVLGINLYANASPEVSEDLRFVVNSGKQRLTGPRPLIQGGIGMILRGAGTTPDHPGRSVAVVVQLNQFLSEAGIRDAENSLVLALRNTVDSTFYGDSNVFEAKPEIIECRSLNQVWQLAALPDGGWHRAWLRSALFFGGNGSAILGLAGILTYVIAYQQQQLTHSVRQRTLELSTAHEQLERDVQLLSAAETNLRISDTRFRAIFEQAAIGVVILHPQSLGILNANQCAVRILGYPIPELKSRTLSQIIHTEDIESCSESLSRLLAGDVHEFSIEHRCVQQDGNLIWVNQMMSAVQSETNRAPMLIALFEDIQDRKSVEQRLQVLADSLPGLLMYIDRSLVVQFVNEMGDKWHAQGLGPASEDVVGYHLRHVLTKEQFEFAVPWIKRALKGEAVEFVTSERVLNGDSRFRSVIYAPHHAEDGSVPGFFSLVMDITDRRRAELKRDELERHLREAQKMEAVGTLAGGIAHDFNNMLQVILGYSDILLLQTRNQPEIAEQISSIQSAARRSSELTQQLLAFARRQSTTKTVLNLNEAVPRMLQLMRHAVSEQIEIKWSHADDLWPVLLDPVQLDQIIANLIVNSRDAIAGTGRITLRARNLPAQDRSEPSIVRCSSHDCVVFSVTDDGCGMDEATQTRMFEPFFTTKELGKGTGLGLSTVYGIVKAHDGVISITSTVNSGTTFDICFPRCGAHHELNSAPAETNPVSAAVETILLVDDEPLTPDLGASLLRKLGYRVIIAQTAAEAIGIAEHTIVHLLITDLVMRDMNGQDLANAIVKCQDQMRVLFISGFAYDTVPRKADFEPEISFLKKPFSPGELANRVRDLLAG